MTTQTKLIYQALLLVGVPIATYALSTYGFAHRDVLTDLELIIYSPIAIGYFAILLALDYYRMRSGKLNLVRGWLRGGIYASIVLFILMIAQNIYFEWYLWYTFPESSAISLVKSAGGYIFRSPQDFFSDNYFLMILIVLMVVALQVNKSIKVDTTTV